MLQKLTLYELTTRIKEVLSENIPGTVWLMAEISELNENRNGHCYLELVEKEGNEIIARARATIWSYTYRILKPYFETTTGQLFTRDIKVLVQVSVEYHQNYGLSLNIKDIDPAYTVGDMALQRREIIERLQNEGIFDMNKELELPVVPQKIAVISSRTAAGYQDFINQLSNNSRGIKFYTHIFEAYMQGPEAVPSIIRALDCIFEKEDFFDAVAIIRGGGATADLNIFDNYELASHTAQFPLPIITGIGHEKDDTIIDLVAHTRMKTPTAVAEFFISGTESFHDRLKMIEDEFIDLTGSILKNRQEELTDIAENLQRYVNSFISEKNKLLIKITNNLQSSVNRFSFDKKHELSGFRHTLKSVVAVWKIENQNNIGKLKRILKRVSNESLLKESAAINSLNRNLNYNTTRYITKEKERILRNENSVRLLNPENILKRGFSLTLKNGKIIKSANSLNPDDIIETRFYDGKTESKILKKEYNGNKKDNIQ